jgi:ABC-type lipoprotein release transport system permease subunit
VGIFGHLTIGFLAGSLLAWLGLLIYTFASLAGRVRHFTILRAIGLSLEQVLASLSIEYLAVIIYGVIAGAIAGIATSKLFLTYFQFTEDPSIQVPPFTPQIAWRQISWIVVAYFGVLLVAVAIVLLRAARREVFQALRMGDEE